ncbi:SGNH/GDSL hydrolase family protein [Actinoplanes sp. RD1]|uniref:hypothetical protein n=1 Tax=Actinoplanes sp. RD1 TaxID=3064538 RepID=UPI00274031BA|nr:hypothetical protein [Actinoplanes sp. RD1]
MTSRVAILGSSSSLGLGVGGHSYAVRYAERLGPETEVLQLSRSALTVAEVTDEMIRQVRDFRPDVVVLSFGAAEGHVHPSRLLQALLDRYGPAGWRGPAGLNPRPYFSRGRAKRLRQLVMSRSKVALKRLIIRATGGFHRMPSDQFAARLREVLDALGGVPKVLVGLWQVDEVMFPRTNALLRHHDDLLQAIAAERVDVSFVATAGLVRYWDDFLEDRAHLNDAGHDRVAGMLPELPAPGGTSGRTSGKRAATAR